MTNLIERFEKEWQAQEVIQRLLEPQELRSLKVMTKNLEIKQIQMIEDYPVNILGMN